MSEVRGGGREEIPSVRGRGGDKRSYPASEVRGGGQEEIPHTPKPEARGGRWEELPHAPTPEARGGRRSNPTSKELWLRRHRRA